MKETQPQFETKSAFVAIVGRPNVGKSSLLNALVGEKVAIVSSKPQTTRTRITGVLTDGDTQLVFIDTPGLHKPRTKLSEYMVRQVGDSVADVDVAVLVVEPGDVIQKAEQSLIDSFTAQRIPAVLVINKIDLAPYVGASLEVMERDSKKMRGDRPFQFTNIRGDENVDKVVEWIKKSVLLEDL